MKPPERRSCPSVFLPPERPELFQSRVSGVDPRVFRKVCEVAHIPAFSPVGDKEGLCLNGCVCERESREG